MTPQTQHALSAHGVVLQCHRPEQVRVLPVGQGARTFFEPFVQLREGLYDVRRIGAYTYLGGSQAALRHVDGIGRFCAIAGGIVAGQAEHGIGQMSIHPMFSGNWANVWPELQAFYDHNKPVRAQSLRKDVSSIQHRSARIQIGNDVWLGYGVFIRRGVKIGDGAVVAANSVVVSDVPPYAVVGGNPARILKYRFSEDIIALLLEARWWDKGLAAVDGLDWTDAQACAAELVARCRDLPDWKPSCVSVDDAGAVFDDKGTLIAHCQQESSAATAEPKSAESRSFRARVTDLLTRVLK